MHSLGNHEDIEGFSDVRCNPVEDKNGYRSYNERGLYTILTKATNFHFIAIGYRRLDSRPVRWM